MYTSYSTTTLALRAKGSFYHTHLSLCNDYGAQTSPRNCLSCCHSSLYYLRRNPRFLLYNYLLRRHSTLIQLETSRSFLLARSGVRVSRRSQDFDGSFQEVIGLLSEECSGLNSKGDAVIKSTGEDFKKSVRKEGFCSKCNAVNKSVDGDFKKSSRKEGFCGGVRREGSSSSYDSANSSSFSGDYEHGRVGSRRIGRADVEEKEIREVRKYEIDANFGRDSRKESKKKAFDQRIRDGEEKVDSWMDSAREAREKHVRDGQEESRKELEFWERNGSTRVASSSKREGFDRRIRDGEDKFDSWRGLAREASEEYVLEEQEGSRNLTKSSNTESYSGSKNVSNEWKVDRGESSTSFVNQHREVDQRVVGQAESRKSSQYGSDVERVAVSQRRFEAERMKDREDRSTSVENLVKVTIDERSLMDQRAVDKMELKKQHETHTSASRIRASDTERANSSKSYLEIRTDAERASNSQRRFEEERMDRENRSTSVQNIVQVTRDKRTQLNHQAAEKMEVNKEYEARTNASRSHASDTEKASSSKSSPEIRTDDREDHSSSVVNLVHGAIGSSRIESEMDSNVSEFRRSGRERVSISQEISNVRQENRKETSSILVQDKKEKQRSTIIGQSSQSTKTQLDLSESLDGGSGSVVDRSKNDAIESASRLDKSSAMHVGEFLNKLRQEISTSDNSEKMEETHGGTSRATTGVEVSVDDATTRYKEEQYIEEGGRQSSSKSGMKGPPDEMWEVRGMSSQEPSKIEEHEEDSSAMEVVDSKASPGITDTAINRRSHRSLWTYIAGIIKMSWGQRAGSHNSTEKSGTRSSSNESISSEAWFSGHEPDENDDETGKKGRNNRLPREPVPTKRPVEQPHLDSSISMGTMIRGLSSTGASLVSGVEDKEWSEGEKGRQVLLSSVVTVDQSSALTGPTASSSTTEIGNVQIPRSGLPKSEEEFARAKLPDAGGTEGKGGEFEGRNGSPKESVPTERPVEQSHLGSSTSMGTMRRGLSSKSVSLVSGAEEIEWTEGEKGRQGIVSSVVTVGQSSALTGILPSPSVTSIGSVQIPGSGLPKLEDKLPEVGGVEGKDGELKRRKLQRSKQVLEEQFDEWEEAYKRDSEQRKIDEFFMREALLEAKKAADTWEVPVGAVLVQNGKIIARGCNLVEELRDSTAHAEMICIREASNLLRTWRLADTTLYVTLEPCPMCAGAILQARIDTVVWGAPNKLLGADGSWVRLFPGGDGGSSSLDPLNQTAGPIHPFHPKIVIRRGILATECSDVMQQFFQLRRKKNKKPEQPPPPSCLPISTHRTKLFTKMHHIFCMMFCL